MEIKYYKNGNATIARGFTNTIGPEGVPTEVFFNTLASTSISSKDHAILMSCADFTSTSFPHDNDVYDEKIGREVARDKTIIKNCHRELKQLDIIKKHLEKQLNNINSRISIAKKKQTNAENRLASR